MNPQTLSDEQLVALVEKGERNALEALYDRHARAVFSLAAYLLRDARRAEDVTQEVFLSLWRYASSYRVERGKVYTWLMSIAHHRSIDELRRDRRDAGMLQRVAQEVREDNPAPWDEAEEYVARSVRGAAVRRAMESLPPEQRKAVVLAYFHGMTQAEIAQALQQPLGTIKTRIRLAAQKLRKTLAQAEEL